ncbi:MULTISPECIES: hypothetical protein [Arthrobacter]|uniref:hypothetical protein n=1 Tax=Arthrobacter TaxID=1663 RepID=UPI00181D8FF9|nr:MULTISPECIES: hypothetical protein [Arthrobacter]NYG18371.1 hypothetical protein [Arthrobacter psychrochitiniphilus]
MIPSPEHTPAPSQEQAPAFPEAPTATALGPWPGVDPEEAAKVSVGVFPGPHLPFLPQLPARGPGSEQVGRTAVLLQELAVDTQPYGWRFVDRPGLDFRRAESALSTDINVLADVVGAAGLSPESLKVQVVGPFSLAAAIHLHYGERALADYGARRDIAQSLAAGLEVHARKVQAAVPGAALTLQVDEPHIGAILAGSIPTASGYRTLRSVGRAEVRQCWNDLCAAARNAGFEQVALNLTPAETGLGQASSLSLPGPANGANGQKSSGNTNGLSAESEQWRRGLEMALECGVDAVALPLQLLDAGHWEHLAGAIESGLGIWAGTVPAGLLTAGTLPAGAGAASAGQVPPSYAVLVERIMRPWRKLGLADSGLNQLRITPEGSLAGVSPQAARAVLGRSLEVAAALGDTRNS